MRRSRSDGDVHNFHHQFLNSLRGPPREAQWRKILASVDSQPSQRSYADLSNGSHSLEEFSENQGDGDSDFLEEASETQAPVYTSELSVHGNVLKTSPPPDAIVEYTESDLAGAKLARALCKAGTVTLKIEANSVYGAAVMMPQVARSSGWNTNLCTLVVSSYFYLALCVALHAAMLMFMNKEEFVLDAFSGQMYLCDFGANMDACRGHGTECLGPGGTAYGGGDRLYGWTQWASRIFIRDSLASIFPERAANIDPGEYGVESYHCRIVCVFLFIISITPEMGLCLDMVQLLWYLPTQGDSWLELPDKEDAEADVIVKVAGMPFSWKAVNCIFVLIPKIFLVYSTAQTGVCFLMETAGIDDIIVNSVALGFLLFLDECVTDCLMSAGANELIDMCKPYEIYADESVNDDELDDRATVWHYKLNEGQSFRGQLHYFCDHLLRWQLVRLFSAAATTLVFVAEYYYSHCEWRDGRFVSRSMYTPQNLEFTYLNAIFPRLFPIKKEDTPYWTMPNAPLNL